MSEIKSKVNTKEYEENYDRIFKDSNTGEYLESTEVKQLNLPLNEYPDNLIDEGWED